MASVDELNDPRVTATVDEYFAALSAGDEGRWLALFADDAICHQPVGSVPAEGRSGLREVWKMLTGPFKRLVLAQDSVFQAGTGAAVKWTGCGRGVNNREVTFEGIAVFEVGSDGKIQTIMAYWDPAAMLIDLAGSAGAQQA